MCRSIRRLREGVQVADEAEIRNAALQYVRKVSGFNRPSARQAAAFEAAVEDIAAASRRLLLAVSENLATSIPTAQVAG